MTRWQQKAARAALFLAFTLAAIAVSAFAVGTSGRVLQVGAAVVLLLIIAGMILTDILLNRLRLANLKYFVLFSFALFIGGGMIADAARYDFAIQPAAILLTYGALLSFVFGFELSSSSRAEPGRAGRPVFHLTSGQLFGVTCFLFVLGFFFLALEWRLYGQVQTYSGKFASASLLPMKVTPYVQEFAQLATPAAFLALIQLRRGTTPFRRAILLLGVAATIGWYLIWGARGNFLWLAVAFLLIWTEGGNGRLRKRVGAKPILAFAVSACAILTLGAARTTWNPRRPIKIGLNGIWEQAKSSLDTYYQFARTLDYFPARAGFLHGYSFYGLVANPIPRAMWPGKPVGVGRLASILYDGNPQNSIGLSLPGELYANFGYAGSLLGMFLFGVLAARIYSWYLGRRGDPTALAIYLMLLSCMMAEVRGDILDATMPLVYVLFPVVACFALLAAVNGHAARKASRSRATTPVGPSRPAFASGWANREISPSSTP